MRKNLTEIVFILDRSGSMAGLEADTIGGFSSLIEKHLTRVCRVHNHDVLPEVDYFYLAIL